jgi:hypothetical protein
LKRTALIGCVVVAFLACNKKSDDANSEVAATAATVNVATPAGTVAVAPGAVTVTQAGAAAPKSVVVGGQAGGSVQVQAGGKKIEVQGPNGPVDIKSLTGLAAKAAAAVTGAAAPNATPSPATPAAPKAPTGPCAQLAAKCPKCTLPMLQQTCSLAVSSGDPASCQNGLNDRDVQANCK